MEYLNMPVIEKRFPSWDAFYQYTRGPVPSGLHYRASVDPSPGFIGCSVKTAHEYASLGWKEGADNARKYSEAIITALGSLIERQDIVYDVEGANLDVARYIEGEPECWMRFEPILIESQSPRFLKIVVNITASAGVNERVLKARGAVLAAMVELLEFAGVRCEIVMAEGCSANSVFCLTTVVLKRSDEPLDMHKVSYVIGHPSVLRVHHFAMMEVMPEWKLMEHSYGMPRDIPDDERGDIYVGRAFLFDCQWENEASAIAWVRDMLKKNGVSFKDETH